jgi:hypothetical protein
MDLSREREEDRASATRPAEPAPALPERAGALDWASAVGNQAVARLARQAMDHEEMEAEGAEAEAEEAPPPEVEQLESQGIDMESMARLDAVDDMAEGDLPE